MRFLFLAVSPLLLSLTSIAQQPVPTTEHHELLKKEVGTWKAMMTMRIPGADKPMVLPGKETNKLMAGGLWLLSDFESGPFVGKAQVGYDPIKNKYVGTWIDNSSAHISVMEGDYDEPKGELTMLFEGVDQATEKLIDMKSITRFVDDDHRSFIMHAKRGDDWVQSFEIQYERAE